MVRWELLRPSNHEGVARRLDCPDKPGNDGFNFGPGANHQNPQFTPSLPGLSGQSSQSAQAAHPHPWLPPSLPKRGRERWRRCLFGKISWPWRLPPPCGEGSRVGVAARVKPTTHPHGEVRRTPVQFILALRARSRLNGFAASGTRAETANPSWQSNASRCKFVGNQPHPAGRENKWCPGEDCACWD
jgi:hypothetical protein